MYIDDRLRTIEQSPTIASVMLLLTRCRACAVQSRIDFLYVSIERQRSENYREFCWYACITVHFTSSKKKKVVVLQIIGCDADAFRIILAKNTFGDSTE